MSENNEKRSDEEQRQIDQDRIARNILEMANNFPNNISEQQKLQQNYNAQANPQTTVNDDLHPQDNGLMPEYV